MIDPSLIDRENWDEHYVKRGDPAKPTYYIIRRQDYTCGIFSNFIVFAGYIRYALFNGWLPVIDMQNYPNNCLPPEKLGKENSWEYYFEQPLRIGLEQAYNGENIILCSAGNIIPPWDKISFYDSKNVVTAEWRMLAKMGLLKVKPALLQEIAAVHKKLFAPNDRMLGVHLRSTDYALRRPKWHPIPPPIEFSVSIVIEKLQEWKCNKIFLATEDKNIVQIFKNIFGDSCVTVDREYIDYNPEIPNTLTRINRPNDHFLQGKEYLTEMMLLTTCTSFVATRCSGSCGVMMMTDDFENVYAFNLGKYGLIGLD